MSKKDQCNPEVVDLLTHKSAMKQEIFRKSKDYFKTLKKVVEKVSTGLDVEVCDLQEEVKVIYKDRSTFECELHFSGDVLLFNMHTNVFTFESNHPLWKTGYVREDKNRAYFSMINIYNFLADSLRYNRVNDAGVLLGRLFINREGQFFMEGRRQMGFLFNHLGSHQINEVTMKKVVEAAMIYSLNFDLTVPEYRDVATVSVREIQSMSEELHIKTSKKAEFGYYSRMQKV